MFFHILLSYFFNKVIGDGETRLLSGALAQKLSSSAHFITTRVFKTAENRTDFLYVKKMIADAPISAKIGASAITFFVYSHLSRKMAGFTGKFT